MQFNENNNFHICIIYTLAMPDVLDNAWSIERQQTCSYAWYHTPPTN